MFKYLRTLNSSNHPTVIDTFPLSQQAIEDGFYLAVGSVVNVAFGEIDGNFTSDLPMYLVVGICEDGITAKCMRLFPGMVIEGTLLSNTELGVIEPGNFVDITTDGLAKGVNFSSTMSREIFEIIDSSNKKGGKVTAVLL